MGLHDMSQEQVVRRLRLAAVALALSVPATAGADTVMLAQNTAPAARAARRPRHRNRRRHNSRRPSRSSRKPPRKLTYDSCEPNRCTSTLAMDATLLREVTAALNAQVVIYALNGQSVQFNIPIKGFDKATAHLRANL